VIGDTPGAILKRLWHARAPVACAASVCLKALANGRLLGGWVRCTRAAWGWIPGRLPAFVFAGDCRRCAACSGRWACCLTGSTGRLRWPSSPPPSAAGGGLFVALFGPAWAWLLWLLPVFGGGAFAVYTARFAHLIDHFA